MVCSLALGEDEVDDKGFGPEECEVMLQTSSPRFANGESGAHRGQVEQPTLTVYMSTYLIRILYVRNYRAYRGSCICLILDLLGTI